MKKIISIVILAVILIGGGAYYFKQQAKPVSKPVAVDATANWKTYTNTTYGYTLRYPDTYEVPPQTKKQISQLGIDGNIGIEKKSESNGSSVTTIVINVNTDKDNMSLSDYLNKNLKLLGITGPLISYNFNGYDSLVNKNQPGTDVFIKRGQYVYHIVAPTASSDKEIENIVATFKFTNQNQTSSIPFCSPNQLLTQTQSQGAAGTMYVNVTIKNVSSSTCQIIGNNFLETHFDSTIQNITISHPKQPTMGIFTLTPNKTLYSLLTYPNGPQCSSAPKQQTMTLSYAISSTNSITFKNSDGPSLYIQDCTSPTEITGINIQPLSDTPITP